jgi:hypothetical protein
MIQRLKSPREQGKSIRILPLALFLLLGMATACAPIKTLDVWKDEGYSEPLHKVLVIAVTKEGYIRNQFENVLSNQLNDRGVEAVPSYKVLPQSGEKLDRDTVVATIKELGIENVLVARAIDKKEITNYTPGGAYFAPTAFYSDGWYTYYSGVLVYSERAYDTDYVTVATNLFRLGYQKPVWSYLAQVKVTDSRQAAVNKFVPLIVQELDKSGLLK